MKSKYLNKVYGKWTVVRVSDAGSGHRRYTLTRKTHDGADKYITLRDNELTKISRGERTVESYLFGKQIERDVFKANIFRNNVFYVYPKKVI